MMSSLCVQLQESSMAPFIGALLVSCSPSLQATLQIVSCLGTESLENSLSLSLLDQTPGGRNLPLKPTRIPIRTNHLPNQNNWLVLLPSQRNDHPCSSLLRWSPTHKRFLHASTPERRTRARVHLFNQREDDQSPRTQDISFKKTLAYQKRWATMRAVAQVNPTAQNTLRLHDSFTLFIV
jgi:hypothetical protein